MMDGIVFIGDEIDSIAYALAGVSVITPEPADINEALDSLAGRDGLRLVMIGARHAQVLGIEELTRRMRLGIPPLMVVGDAAGAVAMPDFSTLLRRRLGVAT